MLRIASLALALLAAGCAATPEWTGRQNAAVLLAEDPRARAAQEEWGFADAVVAGDTVYLSGVVVGLREGSTDLEAAYAQSFERIGAILKRAGAGWDDVVDITTYHTDVNGQMPAIDKVKDRYITGKPPAWTAIQVVRLIPDQGITEIKITAKLRRRK
jgi:enamine deaminase RidA (YjgF/YER057c/UK114 family)